MLIHQHTEENKRKLDTDLSTWEAQFEEAITNGEKPETDIFEGMENEFEKKNVDL